MIVKMHSFREFLPEAKILFVCPLPTYSPKMGPTQKILLPFFAFIFFFFFNVSVRR